VLDVFVDLLTVAALPTTATPIVLPVTFTGTCTGNCTLFPASRPGEPLPPPVAVAPLRERVPGRGPAVRAPWFTHLLPAAGFRSPTTDTVLPHTLTGTSTGS
jgi:hypothetical protein